jgi:predicted nucleic acid-binding protein
VSVYLDASVLVALFTNDLSTERAEAAIRRDWPLLIVSDFAAAEFASAISRRVRMNRLTVDEARSAFSTFDQWITQTAQLATAASTDLLAATGFLRRLDLNLRAPDAINLAIAQRVGATLATFDEKMQTSAARLGLSVVDV